MSFVESEKPDFSLRLLGFTICLSFYGVQGYPIAVTLVWTLYALHPCLPNQFPTQPPLGQHLPRV